MATMEREETKLVVEGTAADVGGEMFNGKSPTVLSCGGIFIPRPKAPSANQKLYSVLNIANDKEPTKLVSHSICRNILQEVLHKETMN